MAGVLVYGELKGDGVDPVTFELIAAASQREGEVAVALLGAGLADVAPALTSRGADTVFLVEHDLLGGGSVDAQVAALEQVCRETSPSIVLVGRTPLGQDVGPRIAFRLRAGLAQGCTELHVDAESGRLVATRPVYGGSAQARVTFPGDGPQVATVRGGAYEPLDPDSTRTGEVVRMTVELEPSVVKTRHVETVRKEAEGVRLEDAKVVVSGGRGLGGPEPFELLDDLARLLSGAVGASRAACDAGWVDHGYQIGLTGKSVAPDLYITVGISGASQHMAGCSSARHIVAINRDGDANIFREAAFGVVGDWNKVLPSFIETVRELVNS